MSEYIQISGVNGGNLSSNPTINGAFALSGYSVGGEATGVNGLTVYDPLVVMLSSAEATPAFNTLLADAASGTIIPSMTLIVTNGTGAIVDEITLGGATIIQAEQAGQHAALAVDYQTITITPYNVNPSTGKIQAGNVVTASTAGGSFASAAMPVLSDMLTSSTQFLELNVSGDTGPSTMSGFIGDFDVAGYSLSLAGGKPGPLVVDLHAAGNDIGVSNLYADVTTGKVIPSVTLAQMVTINGATTVLEQVTLTNATVKDYTDPGGDIVIAFDYTSASLTSRQQNANGLYGIPQTVTLGGTDNTAPFTTDILPVSATGSFLQVSGVTGGVLSSNPTINGGFAVSGYSLGEEATGVNGQILYDPLMVTLSGAEATPGFNTLLADAASGTIISNVTLIVTNKVDGIVDEIILSGATIVEAEQAGPQAALAFDYQSITITPYAANPSTGQLQPGKVAIARTAHGSFAAAPTLALPDMLTNSNQFLELSVSGDSGPSTMTGFIGNFDVTGDSLLLAGGKPHPLVVDLGATGNDIGVSNLYADLITGKVIPSVTLTQVVTSMGFNTIVEQITLTNATVKDYTDPGGDITIAFDYTSASLTSRTHNADGSYGAPQTVTIGSTDDTAPFSAGIAPASTASSFLQVSGIDGGNKSPNPAIDGGFALSGYSLGGEATGVNGQTLYDPLSVTLSGGEGTPGLNTLLADAVSGTIIPSVTLIVTNTMSTTIDEITLSGATIVQAEQAGQQAALVFDYQSITITPFHQIPSGNYQKGNVVTTSTAGGSFASAPTPALSDVFKSVVQTLQLNVSGDPGPSVLKGFAGDFDVTGYSFSLANGKPGPLVVDLGATGNDIGVSNLYADFTNGTVIPSVTLAQVASLNGSNAVVEQILLTNATVKDYTDPGGDITVAFNYTSASLTSRAKNADGSYGTPQTVTFDNPACYCSGTRILTSCGQVAVEDLQVGNRVLTARNGAEAEIIWVGRRTIDVARHAMPEKVFPVRILAGAFGEGLPERDLRLSPDHALFIDGHLIEAKTLVNGVTVVRETGTRFVTYHHIELASHNIVLAEGLPAESYLDSGNRMMFESQEAPVMLHPDFTAVSRLKACAPLVTQGAVVLVARGRLLERAVALGFVTTRAIDLTARVGTETLVPELAGDEFLFMLPSNAASVELISSVGVPAEVSADPGDRRVLGVAITSLALIAGGKRIVISLQNPAHTGFHEMEDGHRWTNGAARIELPKHTGRAVLEVTINGQAPRWVKAA